MVLSKRVRISPKITKYLIWTIIFLNICLRYPFQDHQNGSDSHMYGAMTSLIVSEGSVLWLLHPLSAMGLYPYSDNVSPLFLMAALSIETGLNMEYTVLFGMISFGL